MHMLQQMFQAYVSKLIRLKVSEYDRRIPQSQTTDQPIAPRRDTQNTTKVKQPAPSFPANLLQN